MGVDEQDVGGGIGDADDLVAEPVQRVRERERLAQVIADGDSHLAR
jgi:hypothetical protein